MRRAQPRRAAVHRAQRQERRPGGRHRRRSRRGLRRESRCPPRWPSAPSTDIRLGGTGGDQNLIAGLGGLYVIGTESASTAGQQSSDQQLRGRAGRQGDPGGSVFFASMEDELILQYAPDETRAHVPDSSTPRVLSHAQRVAEGVNLEIHRNTWQYNKLVEDQRRIVLHDRERVLRTDDALSALARQCPERLAELSLSVDRSVLVSAARQDRPVPPGPGLGGAPGLPGRPPRGHPPACPGPRDRAAE